MVSRKDRTCKHCGMTIENASISEIANHSRWCKKNPKRSMYTSQSYQKMVEKNEERLKEKFGEFKTYEVCCYVCKTKFEIQERENNFPSKEKYFCSRVCANSQGGLARSALFEKKRLKQYRNIAKSHMKEQCVVCGFDKTLDVHHVDHNHKNDDVSNLVFLCPNHHRMVHMIAYRNEIEEYIRNWAGSLIEKATDLQSVR